MYARGFRNGFERGLVVVGDCRTFAGLDIVDTNVDVDMGAEEATRTDGGGLRWGWGGLFGGVSELVRIPAATRVAVPFDAQGEVDEGEDGYGV